MIRYIPYCSNPTDIIIIKYILWGYILTIFMKVEVDRIPSAVYNNSCHSSLPSTLLLVIPPSYLNPVKSVHHFSTMAPISTFR